MNQEIFREYDIRGLADVDLEPEAATRLGKAVGTYFIHRRCQRVVMGSDVRLSSDRLLDNLSVGMASTGVDVLCIGRCPTPALYFALHHLEPDAGVMITGSHNPPEYNGLKIAVGKSTIYGNEVRNVGRIAASGRFTSGRGQISNDGGQLLKEYISYTRRDFDRFPRPLRVVIDCGNGAASLVAGEIYGTLGCEIIPLYCEADGRFPNHHPDPTIETNLEDLIRKVSETKADLGIAFDGDGDRLGVVDDIGQIIWADDLMVLFARSLLEKYPGATFVADVKCSKRLFDDIAHRGGRAVMWKSGHSLTRAKMKEENAVMAGELSGHMFFADRSFGYDDGVYAGGRLMEICANSSQRLSEMLNDLPAAHKTPEIRLECPDKYKFEIVELAREYFCSLYRVITVDGIRVIFDDGWGLLRASNTQPALVLRFEADSGERLKGIRDLFESKVKKWMKEVICGA